MGPSANNTALTAEQSSKNGSYPATWYWQQPSASKSQQPSEQGPATTIVPAAAGTPSSTAATGIQPAKEVVRVRYLRSAEPQWGIANRSASLLGGRGCDEPCNQRLERDSILSATAPASAPAATAAATNSA